MHHDVLGRVRWSRAPLDESIVSWLLKVFFFQVRQLIVLEGISAGDDGQGRKIVRCCVRIRRRRCLGGDFKGTNFGMLGRNAL